MADLNELVGKITEKLAKAEQGTENAIEALGDLVSLMKDARVAAEFHFIKVAPAYALAGDVMESLTTAAMGLSDLHKKLGELSNDANYMQAMDGGGK